MRGQARRTAAVAAGLAGLLLAGLGLAGCAPPDGVDGDLTGGWAALPGPTPFVPEAGCHPVGHRETSSLAGYRPVECADSHVAETFHVGEFTGDAADRVTPPPDGSPERRAAYRECDEAATGFLGADFRHGRLWLGVATPSSRAWEGGARWFRCELVELHGPQDWPGRNRRGSLAGALADESDLALGCYQAVEPEGGADGDIRLRPRECDEPHNAEFAGVWRAPDIPYPPADDEEAAVRVFRGCRERVAEYADVPDDGNLVFRTGTVATWMSEAEWNNGDRGFRCYLYLEGAELTESLEGAGTAGLPVR